MKVTKRQFVLSTFIMALSLIGILLCIFDINNNTYQNFLAGQVLLVSLLLVLKYRKNTAFAILFLFIAYANYSVVLGVYWFPEIRPNFRLYDQVTDQSVYGYSIIMMLVYLLAIYLTSGGAFEKNSKEDCFKPVKGNNENIYIEAMCTAAFILIYFTQIDFNATGRAAGNAVSEYRFVAMLFAWAYASKTKKRRNFWTVIIVVTSIITFIGGNRVEALPPIILLIFLWYPEVKISKLLPFLPIVIVIFTIIGGMRNQFRLSGNIIRDAFQSKLKTYYVTDTFTYAYLPGLLTMMLAKIDSFSQKVLLLGENIIYIFVGGKFGKYLLQNYSRNYYLHYYGFFSPLTFYYWFGIGGAFIPAIITKIHMTWMEKNQNQIKYLISCAFIATVPRWYGYNFFQLLRLDFVIVVAWIVFRIFDRMIKRK